MVTTAAYYRAEARGFEGDSAEDDWQHRPTTFEELEEEALRGFRIPAPLHQHVEHLPALVDCAPQVHEFTVDLPEHLIEMSTYPSRPC